MDRGSWHCTGDTDQDHLQEKEMQKSKIVVWGGLTNSCEKKRSEKQRRKAKIYPFEHRVPKNSKERQESLSQWSVQRNRGNRKNGKDWRWLPFLLDFPGGASGKEPTCHSGDIRDPDLIPELGRSPKGGHGNPLQYSCLENPMDCSLVSYSPWGSQRIRHDWVT